MPENTHSRAPDDCPDRNIGNQRGRIFTLPGVKNRRLFEDTLARSFCGLAWKGKNTPRRFRSGQASRRGRYDAIVSCR